MSNPMNEVIKLLKRIKTVCLEVPVKPDEYSHTCQVISELCNDALDRLEAAKENYAICNNCSAITVYHNERYCRKCHSADMKSIIPELHIHQQAERIKELEEEKKQLRIRLSRYVGEESWDD